MFPMPWIFSRAKTGSFGDEDTMGLYAAIVESTHDAVTSTAVDGP